MTQKTTFAACEFSMITQSIVNNLTPVLFAIFKDNFGISYSFIAHLMLINFSSQLVMDILSIHIINCFGYRKTGIFAQFSAILGLLSLGFLPKIISAYPAILIATVFMAFGGGILEVMTSPLVESLEIGHKSAHMSFLHSFYSWGQVIVVLLSTLAIKIFSQNIWWVLPLCWAIIPLSSGILFCFVPIPDIIKQKKDETDKSSLKSALFVLMCILMVCSGSSELAIAEWSSVFAQKGLGVNKFLGDILGPCMFAVLMGLGRVLYGIFGKNLNLKKTLIFSSFLCFVCYMTAAFAKNPYIALLGCAMTGFSVSIMWPGVYSFSAKNIKNGGAAMFGILAFFGDVGCSLGSWLIGVISDFSLKFQFVADYADKIGVSYEQMGLKLGVGFSAVFPLIMFVALILNRNNG